MPLKLAIAAFEYDQVRQELKMILLKTTNTRSRIRKMVQGDGIA